MQNIELTDRRATQIFVPESEALLAALQQQGEPVQLVPYEREFRCVRLANGELEMIALEG